MTAREILDRYSVKENKLEPATDNTASNALDILVGLFVKEYGEMKADFAYQHNLSNHLESQNESLRESEQENAKKFLRLKKLVEPTITWSSEGKPMLRSLFDHDALKEICEILKIEYGEEK